jgi:hypothetical protein
MRLLKLAVSCKLTVGSYLDILDDEHPLVVGVVLGAEPLVGGERLLPSRQNVHITVPHPGHLHKKTTQKLSKIGEKGLILGMHAPDTVFAGYPANPKAGYRISGKGRIPDIRPDTWLGNYIFFKISNKFIKAACTILGFCKH